MLSGGLVQMIDQSGPTEWWPKEQVTYPHGTLLKLLASLLQPLEFGSELTHNFHVEDLVK
jgi:hypothetical protein